MIVYGIATLLSVTIAALGWKRCARSKDKWWLIVLSALPWIIVASIRYDVGADYFYRYVPYFKQMQVDPFHIRRPMEPLLHLIYLVVVSLDGSYVWIFFISAIIFFLCTYYAIFRDSESPALSVYFLVTTCSIFFFFNGMRQSTGSSILLLSLPYIRDKKPIPFLVCVGIATLFHKACLVFVVAYVFCQIRFKPTQVLLCSISIVVLGDLLPRLLTLLISKTEYGFYINSIYDTTGQVGYVAMAINIAIVVFATITYSEKGLYPILYNLQIITMWLAMLSGKVVLIERIRVMFSFFTIFLLPAALHQINARWRITCTVAIVTLYAVYCVYSLLVLNTNMVLPYQTIFGKGVV